MNWDEFALFERASTTARTGEVVGGGRPGLGTLVLAPFAAACRTAVDALSQARLLWTAMVVASAAAFWFLLRSVLRPSASRPVALATALGLWVLAPPFLRYSLQVRTDQPAILVGLLAGLALLASRRRLPWALLAGALFGVGFLFTQKLLYIGGLVGVLAVGQLLIHDDWKPRRELLRAILTSAVFLVVVIGYREIVRAPSGAPALMPVAGSLSSFEYYRQTYGWQLYADMLPSLLPQLLALACLVAATAGWLRDRARHGAELATAWAVLLTGLVVLGFHAGRFPYFYMVLGAFVGAVAALAIGPVLDRMQSPGGRRAIIAGIWIPLAVLGLNRAWAMTADTQRIQRESLDFVERNFPPDARGFQTHSAFTCREDSDPFPTRLGWRISTEFSGDDAAARTGEFIEEFRRRPVSFLILPGSAYPAEAWEFWATHYVHYYAAVHVPGQAIRGQPGSTGTFNAIQPGRYTWRTRAGGRPIIVEGSAVQPGQTVLLPAQGSYDVALPDGGEGLFVLALDDPPLPDPRFFYIGW